MLENEHKKLKAGNFASSKFVNIEKNILIKTLFQHNIFHPDTARIVIGGTKFKIDQIKQTMYTPDKILPFCSVLRLCRARNVNIEDIINDKNENDDCNDEDKECMRKHLIDSIDSTIFKSELMK